MRPRTIFSTPASRRSGFLTPVVASGLAVAVLSGVVGQPGLFDRASGADLAPVADSYDGFDAAAADQLRQDQCLMAEVLRRGGPSMAATAQNGLNQTPDKLREVANRQYWEDTPLSTAFTKDRDAASREGDAVNSRPRVWKESVSGLPQPGGFKNLADFTDPPGLSGSDEETFSAQTGLSKWIWEQFWKGEGDFYEDPTPRADEKTVKAVQDLGTPLYGKKADATLPTWNQDYAEHRAWEDLLGWDQKQLGADNARIFLASGGFPRTASEPGTAEYRIAVEDLKTRFASCAWRTPIDPNKVLGRQVATASQEWQEEIASQAAQRNQILTANRDATRAMAAGAKALSEMLGQSWIADHLARWEDYWSAGGCRLDR